MSNPPLNLSPITDPLIRKWAEALLSGNYVQGYGVLRRPSDNTFCCLGVLADIYDHGKHWVLSNDGDIYYYQNKEDVLPEKLWADIKRNVPGNFCQGTLAEANDCGASFYEIVNEYILPAFAGPTLHEQVEEVY